MAKQHQLVIDNKRPDDDTYPTSKPAEMTMNTTYVAEGTHIVNRDGDIMIVTAGNWKWHDNNTPVADWNRDFIRAKYIGNEDDSLGFANQIRIANGDEIDKARNWTRQTDSYRIDTNGQLLLL